MKSIASTASFVFPAAFVVSFAALLANCHAENWTRFRGPNGTGVSESKNIPLEWDNETNVKWTVDLPGKGSSSPVVFEDRIFLTAYTGYGLDRENPGNPADLKRHLLCYDRNMGTERWRTTVDSEHEEDPYKGFICDHGYASSTPATDGQQVFVLFGKTGLLAFDMEGNQQWKTNLGTDSDPARWGGGASCMLYKDKVIVIAGNVGQAIVALNKSDGSVAWKVSDEKFTSCWSTPSMVEIDGHKELVCSTPGKIIALNPDDGKEIWRANSPIDRTVCGSLAELDGVVFAMGGREGRAVAVKAGGRGDVTESHTVWSGALRSGIGTPVVADGRLYWTSTGIAFCADCETGKYVFKERIKQKKGGRPAGDYASALRVGDQVLLTTRSGATYILKATADFQQVASNQLEDEGLFNATPAISNGEIFIRSESKLYCIVK
jgi:outer membrane protein assembly factor BamB